MPGGSWHSGESSNTVRTEGGSDPGQQYTGDECRSREGRVESASRVRWEVEASKSVRPRAAGQSLARLEDVCGARACLVVLRETVRTGTVRGATPMRNEMRVNRVRGGARFGPKAGVNEQSEGATQVDTIAVGCC